MAAIEKRTTESGVVTYRAKIRIKGHPPVSKTFNRLTDAKRWAHKTENELQEGSYLPQARKHTLGDLIDRYLEESLPKKSEAMQEIQRPQLRWWKKQLGLYLLTDITPALIIEQRAKLEKGKVQGNISRSPSTCNRYIAALRHAFTVAVRDWEWTNDNPAKRVVKLKEPPGRIRCLDNDELQRLFKASQQSKSPYLCLVVRIALSTGMRLNEILSLSWKQVSFSDAVIILYKTKNKRPRRVPLQGEALQTLKEHSRVRRIDTDLVFPSHSNPKKPADIRDAWDYAVERTRLDDFRFHDLRHTAASYFAMSGAAARDLCDIFGWPDNSDGDALCTSLRFAYE